MSLWFFISSVGFCLQKMGPRIEIKCCVSNVRDCNKGISRVNRYKSLTVHPSIRLFQVVGAAVYVEILRPPSLWPASLALEQEHRGVPKPAQRHNLSSNSWVCLEGLLLVGHARNTSLRRHSC